MPVIIFSHGYGMNNTESNLDYNYLLNNLAKQGHFVASIEYELRTDDFLSLEGNPQVVRRTNWDRGAENIIFVLNEIKKSFVKLDYQKVFLIGYSNGGDMSALFVDLYPDVVWKLITLNQR